MAASRHATALASMDMSAPLLGPDRALEQVLAAVPVPGRRALPLDLTLGLVAADDAAALEDVPAFDRAMMDGWAVKLVDAGREVKCLEEIAAGDGRSRPALAAGHAYSIMTGAPVPSGADAVVPFEPTSRTRECVRLPDSIRARANIVPRGSECAVGQVWLHRGEVVTPMTVAAAICVGATTLSVHPSPRIAVLTTGSELTSATPTFGQIRDSNGPMLVALLAEAGFLAERGSVGDDASALSARLEALSDVDVVLLSGGVSAGTHDDVPDVLRRLGATILFHKVAQRPGKPLLVARRGRQLLFGLPGNPLATHLCATRYALPALRLLAGHSPRPRTVRARLAEELPGNPERTWFLACQLLDDGAVKPLLPVSSADLIRPHQADGYLRLESGTAGLPAGSEVTVTLIGAAAWTR
jgi:molybdopterin molybdotransferase